MTSVCYYEIIVAVVTSVGGNNIFEVLYENFWYVQCDPSDARLIDSRMCCLYSLTRPPNLSSGEPRPRVTHALPALVRIIIQTTPLLVHRSHPLVTHAAPACHSDHTHLSLRPRLLVSQTTPTCHSYHIRLSLTLARLSVRGQQLSWSATPTCHSDN